MANRRQYAAKTIKRKNVKGERIMRKKHRVYFESLLKERMGRLKKNSAKKLQQKLESRAGQKEKTFAKFYEMSYNELRSVAKEKNIKTWRKTKEEIIELLIEQEKLY